MSTLFRMLGQVRERRYGWSCSRGRDRDLSIFRVARAAWTQPRFKCGEVRASSRRGRSSRLRDELLVGGWETRWTREMGVPARWNGRSARLPIGRLPGSGRTRLDYWPPRGSSCSSLFSSLAASSAPSRASRCSVMLGQVLAPSTRALGHPLVSTSSISLAPENTALMLV